MRHLLVGIGLRDDALGRPPKDERARDEMEHLLRAGEGEAQQLPRAFNVLRLEDVAVQHVIHQRAIMANRLDMLSEEFPLPQRKTQAVRGEIPTEYVNPRVDFRVEGWGPYLRATECRAEPVFAMPRIRCSDQSVECV